MNSVAFKVLVVTAAFWLSASAGAQQTSNADRPKAAAAVPNAETPDGNRDLTGLWNGAGGNNVAASADRDSYGAVGFDPNLLVARHTEGRSGDAALINFERDGSLVKRMGSNKPMYKPEYWTTVQKLDQNSNTEDPGYGCLPPGVPRVGPPTQIVQTANELFLMYVPGGASGFAPTFRAVSIDGRPHSKLDDLDGTWNGESIGHWEGDTMVIDSIGFNTTTWLDIQGYFHSENMHVIERLHRDGNSLTWQATVEDPDVLLQPWVMDARTIHLNPEPMTVMPESPACSDRDLAHTVTKEHH
jgi:hypothetical protein